MASATGELWAGSQAVMSTATQHAKIESKMLNAHSNEDDEYDEFDEYDDVLDAAAGADAGASTARHWVDSPHKARLYGDRPPLLAAAASTARAKAHVPIWEREERERQQFLFQAHVSVGSKMPSVPARAGGEDRRRRAASASAAAGGHASEEEAEDTYDIGIRWLVRNHKLLVAGFDPGCLAEEKGIRKGDILRAVDGVDVLNMKQREDGSHEAEELLMGELGTECSLTLLRPQEQDDKGSVALKDYSIMLPRCLPAE